MELWSILSLYHIILNIIVLFFWNSLKSTFCQNIFRLFWWVILSLPVNQMQHNQLKPPHFAKNISKGPECGQDFCRLGCVCSSLHNMERGPAHCRRSECMFGCNCFKRKITKQANTGVHEEQNHPVYCEIESFISHLFVVFPLSFLKKRTSPRRQFFLFFHRCWLFHCLCCPTIWSISHPLTRCFLSPSPGMTNMEHDVQPQPGSRALKLWNCSILGEDPEPLFAPKTAPARVATPKVLKRSLPHPTQPVKQ